MEVDHDTEVLDVSSEPLEFQTCIFLSKGCTGLNRGISMNGLSLNLLHRLVQTLLT